MTTQTKNNEKEDALTQLEEELQQAVLAKCREDFYTYVQYAAPWLLPEGFIDGYHIREICKALQDVYDGKCKRLMIFLPPRSSKSTLSQLFQSWVLGRRPVWTIMGISYASSLATEFSRNVRNIVNSPEYQELFPGVALAPDSKAANRWNTNHGGRYFAAGITSGIAGRGAHIAIVDDPLSEQDAASKTKKEFVRSWYPGGLRTRLHPSVGAIIIITTRWAQDDLAGWLLENAANDPRSDQWRVIEFPAIIVDEEGKERSYWPEWKPLEELQQFRDDPTTPRQTWWALYMQKPVPADGAIIKEEYFKVWSTRAPDGKLVMPPCEALIMSADTAYSEKERADNSVLHVWGVFSTTNTDSRGVEHVVPNAILLANRYGKWAYPELYTQAKELIKKYNPDRIIVEKKASGEVLYPDLLRAGLPVVPFTPGKGQDKMARVQAVLRHFVAGRVWIPDSTSWTKPLLDEACAFPYGKNDDQVDAMTLALLYLRDIYALLVPDEQWEEPKKQKRKLYW